jgi:quercetin dioxygenase-like cupin family protein
MLQAIIKLLKLNHMKRTIVNPIFRDTATYLQTAAESNGKITEFEMTLMPGGANPLHYHFTFSETFTAIDGDLGVRLGKKNKKILKPGESHTVEPMALHSFFNSTNREIRFNIQIQPGHEGFENSLRIIYGLAEDGLANKQGIPKSLKHKAIVACMADMNIPGFFTLIFPLLKRIAKKAKDSGVEQQLIDRYCN